MDSTIGSSEIVQASSARSAAIPMPDDSLGFFQALWFLIPMGLALWSAIIWGITRFI